MQIRVSGTPSGTPPPDYHNPATLAALQTALPAAYAATQDPPIVGASAYNAAFKPAVPWVDNYARIFTGSAALPLFAFVGSNGAAQSLPVQNKAIQELFDTKGRMNATLGVELPATSALVQTTIPLSYIDPPTEVFADGEMQIWKITHNGVDTHAIHVHLFDAQLVNRVGWDGIIKPPDANEVGWKDTIRMNPLEDVIIAVRPHSQTLPWTIPESVRPLDVTAPIGSTMGFTGVDPTTGRPTPVSNQLFNFGWEYVWHCHLLGHEENDMMRPMVLRVGASLQAVPVALTPSVVVGKNAASQSFNVWQGGAAASVSFTVTKGATPWLSVSPASGMLTTAAQPITVTYSTAGLAPGIYNGAITVTANPSTTLGSPKIIAVTLTVAPAPVILDNSLSLTTKAFAAGTGGSVVIRTNATNGYVIVDAVRFTWIGP